MNNKFVKFSANEVIFRQGVFEDFMYCILNGTVSIFVDYGKPSERKLVDLHEGKFFGEMGVLESMPRSATAVATTDVELEKLGAEAIPEFLQHNYDKTLEIMRNMSKRTRELTNDYLDACKTADEIVETNKSGKKKSEGLLGKIKRFAKIWAEAEQQAAMNGYTLHGYGAGIGFGFPHEHF